MANLSVELKNGKLYIRFYHNKLKTLLPTNLFLSSNFWDLKNKQIKNDYPDKNKADLAINNLLQRVRSIIFNLENENVQITPKAVKSRFIDVPVKIIKVDFWEHFNTFMDDSMVSWKINEVVTETNGTLILSGIYSVKNNILYRDGGITCVCGGDTIKSLTSNTMQLQSYNLNYLTKQ
jgi:hypothetical protein